MRKTSRCTFLYIGCMIVLLNLFMTACSSESNELNSYQMQNLPDGNYILDGNGTVLYPYGDRIYVADSENGGVGYYDPLNDMTYTSLSSEKAMTIYVNEEGIFTCTGEQMIWMNTAGEIQAEWNIEGADCSETEITDPMLCVTNTTALFMYNIWGEGLDIDTYFSVLNRNTGESAVYKHDRETYMIGGQYRIIPDNDDFLILCNVKHNGSAYSNPALIRYSVKNNKTEFVTDCENVSEMDLVDGETYAFDTGMQIYKLIKNITAGEMKTVLRNFDETEMVASARAVLGDPEASIYKSMMQMFYTGQDVLLWEPKLQLLTIADTQVSVAETLYILYPVTDMDQGMKAHTGYVDLDIYNFEMKYDCSVQSTYYSNAEFSDRLRMKLLAGEDDMDVIYIDQCDKGDMLSAILRYGLYYPLEKETAIIENFNQFADGVREYMTYDGHLIGVPYSFYGSCYVVTEEYVELGLPVPDVSWTLDDFWELCETASKMDTINGNTVLAATNQCTWILDAILENGYRNGKMDESSIREAVQNLKRYYDEGVLVPWLQAGTVLLDSRAKVPAIVANNTMYEKSGMLDVLPVPTVNGSRYMPLKSFMFVYSGTKNKDMAVAYMTMLTDKETISRIDGDRSHFLRDISAYYMPSFDFSSQNGYVKVKEKVTEEERQLLSGLSNILPGTKLQTTSYMENRDTWNTIFEHLFTGEMTVEEAVDEIMTYGEYRYLE